MTGIRKSMIFAKECEFGKGAGNNPWFAPPPGTFFSHQHNRSTNRIDAMGTKSYDAIAYGKESGLFDWSFNLDYNYLEFLQFVFEVTESGNTNSTTNTEFTLSKSNTTRVPSFCVRLVTLNEMAGGPDNSDEVLEIRGCVVKSIRFSMSAGASQWGVSVSGFNTQERFWIGKLSSTDYRAHVGQLVEFACLFNDATILNKTTYIANCSALQMSIENNAEIIDATCTPFSPAYLEGKTNYAFSTSVYSNNPKVFKQRLYTGGKAVTKDLPGYDEENDYLKSPLCKNLAPMSEMSIVSYDLCCNAKDAIENTSGADELGKAVSAAKNKLKWDLKNLVIKSMSWMRGDGEKIMDQISSVECQTITMNIKLNADSSKRADNLIINPANIVYNPVGPRWDNSSKAWIENEWTDSNDNTKRVDDKNPIQTNGVTYWWDNKGNRTTTDPNSTTS
jgi:hypothetical protein